MSERDGVDWEALAKTAFGCEYGLTGTHLEDLWANEAAGLRTKHDWEGIARAVITEYLEQRAARGFIEVRQDEYANLLRIWHAVVDAEPAMTTLQSMIAAHAPVATEDDR